MLANLLWGISFDREKWNTSLVHKRYGTVPVDQIACRAVNVLCKNSKCPIQSTIQKSMTNFKLFETIWRVQQHRKKSRSFFNTFFLPHEWRTRKRTQQFPIHLFEATEDVTLREMDCWRFKKNLPPRFPRRREIRRAFKVYQTLGTKAAAVVEWALWGSFKREGGGGILDDILFPPSVCGTTWGAVGHYHCYYPPPPPLSLSLSPPSHDGQSQNGEHIKEEATVYRRLKMEQFLTN